jgi:hypothetical protein
MTDNLLTSVVTVLTAIIAVAILAVLVSGKSHTADVLRAGGSAFSGILGSALSPVTGQNFTGGGVQFTFGG